jgi:predicted nucleic acid-binding Zn ribbon protein
MRKRETENIGSVVRAFLRENGLESPLNEQRIIDAWPKILGPGMAQYSKDLYIKNEVLYVHLTSSVLRQELMMVREKLVHDLNAYVGATVIRNIIFR